MFQIFRQRRKVFKSPKVFSSSRGQIVIPYRPIGAVITLTLLFLCLYFFFRSDLFLVHKFEIKRQNVPNQANFINEKTIELDLMNLRGRSVYSIDLNAEAERLKKSYLSLETVTFERRLPDILIIFFKERQIAARVEGKNGIFLIDTGGFVFSESKPEISAPTFQNKNKEIKVGDKLDSKEVNAIIYLIKEFGKRNLYHAVLFDIKQYPTIFIKTSENVELIFDGEEDTEDQLATLQLIIRNATIEGKTIKKIDLRFKRPVVSY